MRMVMMMVMMVMVRMMMMRMVVMMVMIMMMMIMMTTTMTTTIMILRTTMVMNVLHFPTADVAALNDDQDNVIEYDVEIRAGLSTRTRHFSLSLLQLIIPFKAFVFVFGPSVERPFSGSEKEIYDFKQLFVTENKLYLSCSVLLPIQNVNYHDQIYI